MTTPDLKYPLSGRRAYLVWGTAVSIYFLAVFHRSSLGVAGIIAAQRFHITSAQLGTFVMLQLFVYAAHFRGGHAFEGMSSASEFARFTVVGYVIVMAVSFCLLWLLGQTDGNAWQEIVSICIVLSFPGAIGAAAARLIL